MLGMIFGVGAVIAMMSIGAGAERQALASIERLGLRNVLVRAKTFKDERAEGDPPEVARRLAARRRRDLRSGPGRRPGRPAHPHRPLQGDLAVGQERRRRGLRRDPPPRRSRPSRSGRGALPRSARRERPRPGLRDRARGAARSLRLRPGGGAAGEGQRRLAGGGRRARRRSRPRRPPPAPGRLGRRAKAGSQRPPVRPRARSTCRCRPPTASSSIRPSPRRSTRSSSASRKG